MAGSMVYRLRVAEPNTAHMETFIRAMTAIQARLDNKSFNFVGGLHGAPGWYCRHGYFCLGTEPIFNASNSFYKIRSQVPRSLGGIGRKIEQYRAHIR